MSMEFFDLEVGQTVYLERGFNLDDPPPYTSVISYKVEKIKADKERVVLRVKEILKGLSYAKVGNSFSYRLTTIKRLLSYNPLIEEYEIF